MAGHLPGSIRQDSPQKGDQYTFVAMASSARAIITYRTGKRDTGTTHELVPVRFDDSGPF
jgi:hypothetical protein